MAGVFFEVFALISLLAVGVALFGFWKQKLVVLPVAVVLFILAGALLLSQGLQYESGSVFDVATGVTTYTFSTVDSSDPSILLVGIGFIAISLILAIMSFRIGVQGGEK